MYNLPEYCPICGREKAILHCRAQAAAKIGALVEPHHKKDRFHKGDHHRKYCRRDSYHAGF